MAKHLPPHPNLGSLRNQAKQLLQAHRTNDADARLRLLSNHPRFSDADPGKSIRLTDAQLVIAREYGFDSWPKLKQHVEAATGMEGTVVADADSLTPAWLTGRLRLRGHLPAGEVVSFRREDTNPSKSGVHRLHVTYSSDVPTALPPSFIYKFNTKGSHRPYASSVREAFFYRELLPSIPDYRVAACFDMGVDTDQQSYLLLEDLEPTHHLPPAANNSPFGGWLSLEAVELDEFAAIVRKLARFQARWWNDPIIHREPLVAASPGLGSLNNAGDPSEIPENIIRFERVAEELPPEMSDLAHRCIEGFPVLYRHRLRSSESLTLMHVDFHLRSVLLPNDGDQDEVVIIDWETVQRGIGVSDVAHLMLSSMLPVERRRRFESTVIGVYHDELLRGGVGDYSLDDCRADYRLSIVGLIGTVIAPPFLRACDQAFADWECEQLFT